MEANMIVLKDKCTELKRDWIFKESILNKKIGNWEGRLLETRCTSLHPIRLNQQQSLDLQLVWQVKHMDCQLSYNLFQVICLAIIQTAWEILPSCYEMLLSPQGLCLPLLWSVQQSCRLSCVQKLQEVSANRPGSARPILLCLQFLWANAYFNSRRKNVMRVRHVMADWVRWS